MISTDPAWIELQIELQIELLSDEPLPHGARRRFLDRIAASDTEVPAPSPVQVTAITPGSAPGAPGFGAGMAAPIMRIQ